MNISGCVRIDLSGYVEYGHLHVLDREVGDVVRRHFTGGTSTVVVDIGDATFVDWDPRLIEALSDGFAVVVEGSCSGGVDRAVAELRRMLERIPGPRSAS